MEFLPAVDPEQSQRATESSSGGIALFMVIAAVALLSVLITEFTYIASINQKMAYDSLDLVKTHYVAKSAMKLSLLRLKAYQHVKAFIAGAGAAAGGAAGAAIAQAAVPKGVLEKIWSFPFFYPLPTNIPGMTAGDKEALEQFQKDTNLEGRFTAAITSESARYNLNQALQAFAPSAQPSATPSSSPRPGASATPQPSATPSAQPSFNPEEARKAMTEYFNQIIANKFEDDPDFATEHRDLKLEEIMDQIFGWEDRTYERKTPSDRDPVKFRKSPFNTVTELHMLPLIDDELYDLFAPTLTVSSTPGINVNTMDEPVLKILVPGITKEEVADFFKFRDSEEEDNLFKSPDDFFKYLQTNVASLRQGGFDRFKDELNKKTRLITDETQFKITVTAQVNQSTELIEAWVTLGDSKATSTTPGGQKNPAQPGQPAAPPPPPGQDPTQPAQGKPDTGLKITFMRIL